MYESELNWKIESLDQIPPAVRQAFCERKAAVRARSVLSWSEHCTECAAPACFQSCELYEARPRDEKCRRFVDGMVRIDHPDGLMPYLIKIRFKRWGKLWSEGNTRLYSLEDANRLERRDKTIGAVLRTIPLQLVPLPATYRRKVVTRRYLNKKRFSRRPNVGGRLPNQFLIECYNPNAETIRGTFTIKSKELEAENWPAYQRLLVFQTGFNRIEIPVGEMTSLVDLRRKFVVSIVPNEIADGTTLYFGITEFVELASSPRDKSNGAPGEAKECKCIVWDLDNTVWSGVLIEDGLERLTLKPGVVELIKDLDERGILHSIASKNNPAETLEALRHFGLDDYFLCPQISWNPKSGGVRQVAAALNIGADTLLFVDDQPFEREEVQSVLPEVRVLDSADFLSLRERVDCQGSQTDDARQRRKLYQEQLARQQIEQSYGDEGYHDFLRDCRIVLDLRPMSAENIDRVHELAQRTNQLNFSGNRYERAQLVAMLNDPQLDTYVLDCRDKFGAYGTVGFCVVDRREPRMIDLAFSCRIQNKRVEHAFLSHLLKTYAGSGDFLANYRQTDRNAPQGRVFGDLGFEDLDVRDGVTTLVFRQGQPIPDDGIVEIVLPAEDAVAP